MFPKSSKDKVDKCYVILLIYVIIVILLKKKKVQMNLFTKQKSHLLKTNLWVPEVGGSENLGDCG